MANITINLATDEKQIELLEKIDNLTLNIGSDNFINGALLDSELVRQGFDVVFTNSKLTYDALKKIFGSLPEEDFSESMSVSDMILSDTLVTKSVEYLSENGHLPVVFNSKTFVDIFFTEPNNTKLGTKIKTLLTRPQSYNVKKFLPRVTPNEFEKKVISSDNGLPLLINAISSDINSALKSIYSNSVLEALYNADNNILIKAKALFAGDASLDRSAIYNMIKQDLVNFKNNTSNVGEMSFFKDLNTVEWKLLNDFIEDELLNEFKSDGVISGKNFINYRKFFTLEGVDSMAIGFEDIVAEAISVMKFISNIVRSDEFTDIAYNHSRGVIKLIFSTAGGYDLLANGRKNANLNNLVAGFIYLQHMSPDSNVGYTAEDINKIIRLVSINFRKISEEPLLKDLANNKFFPISKFILGPDGTLIDLDTLFKNMISDRESIDCRCGDVGLSLTDIKLIGSGTYDLRSNKNDVSFNSSTLENSTFKQLVDFDIKELNPNFFRTIDSASFPKRHLLQILKSTVENYLGGFDRINTLEDLEPVLAIMQYLMNNNIFVDMKKVSFHRFRNKLIELLDLNVDSATNNDIARSLKRKKIFISNKFYTLSSSLLNLIYEGLEGYTTNADDLMVNHSNSSLGIIPKGFIYNLVSRGNTNILQSMSGVMRYNTMILPPGIYSGVFVIIKGGNFGIDGGYLIDKDKRREVNPSSYWASHPYSIIRVLKVTNKNNIEVFLLSEGYKEISDEINTIPNGDLNDKYYRWESNYKPLNSHSSL